MSERVSAAILAGGQARRLGGVDKSALTVGAQSILDRQLALLHQITPAIVIVANDASRFRDTGVRVVGDRLPGTGALGGLYTALVEAPAEQVLVLACDMPFLTVAFLRELVERGKGADVAVPHDARGLHPLCASYHRRIASHFEARLAAGVRRVRDALQGLAVHEMGPDDLAPFDRDGRLLVNVNTPEEYTVARDSAASPAPSR